MCRYFARSKWILILIQLQFKQIEDNTCDNRKHIDDDYFQSSSLMFASISLCTKPIRNRNSEAVASFLFFSSRFYFDFSRKGKRRRRNILLLLCWFEMPACTSPRLIQATSACSTTEQWKLLSNLKVDRQTERQKPRELRNRKCWINWIWCASRER